MDAEKDQRIPDDIRRMLLRDLTQDRKDALRERGRLMERMEVLNREIQDKTSAIIYLRKGDDSVDLSSI